MVLVDYGCSRLWINLVRLPILLVFSLSVEENKQIDAGQDGRTHLVRPNSQARTGTGKCSCFPVQLTTSRIGNNTRLICTLLNVLTIHTYI